MGFGNTIDNLGRTLDNLGMAGTAIEILDPTGITGYRYARDAYRAYSKNN